MKHIIVPSLVVVAVCVSSVSGGTYSGGDGNEANPYKIANAMDLLELRENTDDYDKHFIQTADISLSGAGDEPDGTFSSAVIAGSTAGSGFNGVAFQGVYDGNSFTVSDLAIDATTSTYDYLGLFGKVHNGLIKNLKLKNISIDGEYIQFVGGVAGFNYRGTIRNCNSSVALLGGINSGYFGGVVGYNERYGLIEKCSASGSISGSISEAGGLAGWNDLYSVIRDCNSSCSVNGNIYIGGLVGINKSSQIFDSYATGNITGASLYYYVGGLVGDNDDGLISDCYATGTVSGNREVGGLAGRNYFRGTIVNCYATGQVDGVRNVGGFVGINEDIYEGVISHCYAAGDVSGTTAVGGFCGYNPDNHLADPIPIIVNCFWNTTVQTHGVTEGIGVNNELVSNVLGKTTSQMQMQSTFTDYGWDFVNETVNGPNDIWTIHETVDYPKHVWPLVNFIGWYEVDFRDYSYFANHWKETNCGTSNDCDGADLDFSDTVDWKDLRIFCNYYLEGAE
jgi:hypothetical protein